MFHQEPSWSPGIGDPTFLGWFTVAAYFGVAWLVARTSGLDRRHFDARERIFWRALLVALVFLGINKQLDLQSAFTHWGRQLALEGGFYEERRALQKAFIAALLLAGVGAVGVGIFLLRRAHFWARLAAAGVTALVVFVLVRAASFHRVDLLLKDEFLGVRWNGILELGGLLVIATGAHGRRGATLRRR